MVFGKKVVETEFDLQSAHAVMPYKRRTFVLKSLAALGGLVVGAGAAWLCSEPMASGAVAAGCSVLSCLLTSTVRASTDDHGFCSTVVKPVLAGMLPWIAFANPAIPEPYAAKFITHVAALAANLSFANTLVFALEKKYPGPQVPSGRRPFLSQWSQTPTQN